MFFLTDDYNKCKHIFYYKTILTWVTNILHIAHYLCTIKIFCYLFIFLLLTMQPQPQLVYFAWYWAAWEYKDYVLGWYFF